MFIASVPGTDPRVFLVLGNGKRQIPNTTVLAQLKAAGIRDVGDVPLAALNIFPDLTGMEAVEAGERTSTATALTQISAGLSALRADVSDDATAAQVADVVSRVEQLRADLDPEGDPTP